MLPILAIRHIPCEGPGLIEGTARKRGVEIRIAEVPDQFPRWPEPAQYGALLVLGGPMSAYDTHRYPWIREEIRLIRRCFDEGIPVLGICLGAQLLAAACGAKVYSGGRREIGWSPIRLRRGAQTDPLFNGLPDSLVVFHWHGDTFELPQDSQLLASSDLFPHQAFRVADRWYGFQFHLEVTGGMLHDWTTNYSSELSTTGGPTVGNDPIETEDRLAALKVTAEKVFERWLDLVNLYG